MSLVRKLVEKGQLEDLGNNNYKIENYNYVITIINSQNPSTPGTCDYCDNCEEEYDIYYQKELLFENICECRLELRFDDIPEYIEDELN